MNLRTLTIAALIFFSLAPMALANGQQSNGTTCVFSDGRECNSGVCSDFLGSRTCAPCTGTSCGTGFACQNGICDPNPVTTNPNACTYPTCTTDNNCHTGEVCRLSANSGPNGGFVNTNDCTGTCRQPTGNEVCAAYGPGTGCTLSSGASGVCNASGICQAGSTAPINQTQTGAGTNQTQGGAGTNQVQVGAGNPNNTSPVVTLINPLGNNTCGSNGDCLQSFLNSILQFVIRIGTVVVILMLVYVGYLFVAARGNDTKITEARNALLWTIVGALILLGAEAIAKGIEATVKAIGT